MSIITKPLLNTKLAMNDILKNNTTKVLTDIFDQ